MSQAPPIILASASPRRRALLEALGLPIEVRISRAEERTEGVPEDVVLHNACAKRDAVLTKAAPGSIVIAADTEVVLNDTVLGKPKDAAEAAEMLGRLSGRTHRVMTGVAVGVANSRKRADALETTHVTFRQLRPGDIKTFIDLVQPFDRAGGYTVDGPGSLLVERLEGCFYNVLGLPLVRLDRLLADIQYDLFDRLSREWKT